MKKLIISIILTAAVAVCFAPIHMAPPAGTTLPPEATQKQLEEQQALQQAKAPVGVVEQKTDKVDLPETNSDAAAKSMVVKANSAAFQTDDPKAADNLRKAEESLKGKSDGKRGMVIWAVLFGVFGFGVVYGVKTWANKNIPDMPAPNKKVNW